jgi:hypothetical protein
MVLVVLGLFLPWVEWTWASGVFGDSNYILGIDVPLGAFALVGWLVVTASWVLFMIIGRKLSPAFVIAGGIETMICSFASIVNPGTFLPTSQVFTAAYGAYVSLTGGTMIMISATFSS